VRFAVFFNVSRMTFTLEVEAITNTGSIIVARIRVTRIDDTFADEVVGVGTFDGQPPPTTRGVRVLLVNQTLFVVVVYTIPIVKKVMQCFTDNCSVYSIPKVRHQISIRDVIDAQPEWFIDSLCNVVEFLHLKDVLNGHWSTPQLVTLRFGFVPILFVGVHTVAFSRSCALRER